MTTYAEAIAEKRKLREEMSAVIEDIRVERNKVSAEILALELAITPPKQGRAKPGDIVMTVDPAILKASPKGGV